MKPVARRQRRSSQLLNKARRSAVSTPGQFSPLEATAGGQAGPSHPVSPSTSASTPSSHTPALPLPSRRSVSERRRPAVTGATAGGEHHSTGHGGGARAVAVSREPVQRRMFITAFISMGIALLLLLFAYHLSNASTVGFEAAAPAPTRQVETRAVLLQEPAGPDLYVPRTEAPNIPPTHAANGTPGVQEALNFFYQAYDYALQTGDISPLQVASAPDCRLCQDLQARISNLHATAPTVKALPTTDLELTIRREYDEVYTVGVRYHSGGFEARNAKGEVIAQDAAGDYRAVWQVAYLDGAYRLTSGVITRPAG